VIAVESNDTDYYASVPLELKLLPNWVGWKLTLNKDKKLAKLPYSSPSTLADSTNPQSWRQFTDVCKVPPLKDKGVGFVFDGNGIVGIDLDHCLVDGVVADKFAHIVDTLHTYTEVSPSGTGLHLFIKCTDKPYETGRKKGDFEIYSEDRYFTITGDQFNGSPNEIVEFPVELIRELSEPFLSTPPKIINATIRTQSCDLSDEDILSILSHSANSHKFNMLYAGSISEYGGDASRADMALASILAFYSTDTNQIERIMRQSNLVRNKWDTHKTYLRDMTISKAIRDCTNHYEPPVSIGTESHGELVAADLMANLQVINRHEESPNPYCMEQLSESELDAIREAVALCDDLPPLPEIIHPLFKQWMDLGSELMYSHPSYHFGNLLPIASMALGRRVGVMISTKYTYTNFNVMLVGTSTISGKSFSSDTAIDSFGSAIVNIQTPSVNPADSTEMKRKSCSNPRLVQDMASVNNMLWYYDEAKEFFDEAGEGGWNAPIIANLCTAYDGGQLEVARSNKSRNREGEDNTWICPTPFLSLLFNMTINQLKEASTTKIISSGFFYRWLWFLEQGGERKRNVTATDKQIERRDEIRNEFLRVGTIVKSLDNNAITFVVNDKIEDWSMEIGSRSNEENYQAAIGRGVIHVYKMAMLFAMFDPEFHPTVFNQPKYPIRVAIPDRWVKEAIKIVEQYLLPRVMIVIEYSERVDVLNKQLRVLDALKKMGGVTDHSSLLKKTKLDSTEFSRAIKTLIESGEINTCLQKYKKIYYINIESSTSGTDVSF